MSKVPGARHCRAVTLMLCGWLALAGAAPVQAAPTNLLHQGMTLFMPQLGALIKRTLVPGGALQHPAAGSGSGGEMRGGPVARPGNGGSVTVKELRGGPIASAPPPAAPPVWQPRRAAASYQAPVRRRRPAAAAARVGGYVTTYAANPQAQRKAIDSVCGKLSAANPQVGALVKSRLLQMGVDPLYRELLAGTGLKDHDLADALTAYTVLNLMIVQNLQETPEASNILVLRREFANYLSAHRSMPRAAERAAAAEEVKVALIVIHAGWQDVKQNGGLDEFRQQIATSFQESTGVDLRSEGASEVESYPVDSD